MTTPKQAPPNRIVPLPVVWWWRVQACAVWWWRDRWQLKRAGFYKKDGGWHSPPPPPPSRPPASGPP